MINLHSTCLIAALLALSPMAVAAQDDADAGGMRLTFDLSQRLEATTNADLTDTTTTRQTTATTRLNAGFLSETRSERLSFDLSTGVRITDGTADAADPSLVLAYRRVGPTAQLDMDARWAQSSFDTLRNLTTFTAADGTLVLPDDLDDLTGTGTRTTRSGGATLRWGENAPLGVRLGLTLSDLRYSGDTTLTDSQTASVTAGLRFTLTPVSSADISLRYGRTDDDDGTTDDTTRLTATYTLDRPLGAVTATLTADRDADDDTRLGLTFGRRYALPEATLDASIGLTQNSTGDPALTGRLAWQQTLPTGQIRLNLAQAVAAGSDDDTDTTTIGGTYSHTLTPRSNLQLGFDFARAADSDTSTTTRSLSASYGYQLTPDWQVSLGATTRLRDASGSARTDAQSVFMTLNRSLTLRP